jgi:HAD superfamily hydrolase (TIGR01450 family)
MLDAEAAFARYEAIRDRLPAATFEAQPREIATLADAVRDVDGFVLDAFGVLNVGERPIAGAVARMAELRAAGKALVVLTNAASYPRAAAVEKFRRLGFDFPAREIVSSRDVAAMRLEAVAPGARWAAIAAADDDFADIPARVDDFTGSADWDSAEAILFLSTARWSAARQEALVRSLAARPRPVVIANPDLVAPREDGLSVEPGFWGHDIQDRAGIAPRWFGKPFGDAFAEARQRAGVERLAMVGDTLHTDILGGRAAGMRAVLIADHGLFAGRDVRGFIQASGIRPDLIAPTT